LREIDGTRGLDEVNAQIVSVIETLRQGSDA